MKETLRRGFAKMRGFAGAFLLMEEPLFRKSDALSPSAPVKGQSGRTKWQDKRQDKRQEEQKEEQKEERRRSRIGIRPLPREGREL